MVLKKYFYFEGSEISIWNKFDFLSRRTAWQIRKLDTGIFPFLDKKTGYLDKYIETMVLGKTGEQHEFQYGCARHCCLYFVEVGQVSYSGCV